MFDKNKLFLIIAIVVAIIVIYYVASPYQPRVWEAVVSDE
jgi:hypothetical protein